MSEIILNGNIEKLGGKASGWIPLKPTDGTIEDVQLRTEAELFEQLLLFDKIVIKVGRDNFGLAFLIHRLGYKKVRELIERDLLRILLWTPVLVTSTGRRLDDGTIDHSAVIGTPPLTSGSYQPDDMDPEINLDRALDRFPIGRGSKRAFKRDAIDKYVLPDPKVAGDTKAFVMDAYNQGRLTELGLPNNKKPEDLDYLERQKLLDLGAKVLETTILSQNNYSSFEQLDHLLITKDALKRIGSALDVASDTEKILEIENMPNLRELYIKEKLDLAKVIEIRQRRTVKEFRKWIQSLTKKEDSYSITKEYLDEVTGKNKFFDSAGGKFLKNVGLFGIGTGLGAALGGVGGAAVGGVLSKAGEFGLGILDTYLLDNLLKGWNPRLFVKEIQKLKAD